MNKDQLKERLTELYYKIYNYFCYQIRYFICHHICIKTELECGSDYTTCDHAWTYKKPNRVKEFWETFKTEYKNAYWS